MITILSLSPRIVDELVGLIRFGEASPTQLARRAPALVVSLAGRRAPTAATDAHAKLVDAVDSLTGDAKYAARVLLALEGKPRTTLTSRRALIAKRYGISIDRFARTREKDVIIELALALAERTDPDATLPATYAPTRRPPALRTFRRHAPSDIHEALRTMANQTMRAEGLTYARPARRPRTHRRTPRQP
ncbi:hypothetical protein [Pseudofrankia asymbiotica]|uniref:Uncharacterized protein n=1 Tax=Pseudofrankia asymbiotica TaxID=1834516 RepID=A0A1V2I5E6_9ACTN|nr:hypothetical protein [Pseudofrankia asymbiotica]ONH24877.1 hypothetical protein BL253_28805 [Pseudofrankia asymbiotica]